MFTFLAYCRYEKVNFFSTEAKRRSNPAFVLFKPLLSLILGREKVGSPLTVIPLFQYFGYSGELLTDPDQHYIQDQLDLVTSLATFRPIRQLISMEHMTLSAPLR